MIEEKLDLTDLEVGKKYYYFTWKCYRGEEIIEGNPSTALKTFRLVDSNFRGTRWRFQKRNITEKVILESTIADCSRTSFNGDSIIVTEEYKNPADNAGYVYRGSEGTWKYLQYGRYTFSDNSKMKYYIFDSKKAAINAYIEKLESIRGKLKETLQFLENQLIEVNMEKGKYKLSDEESKELNKRKSLNKGEEIWLGQHYSSIFTTSDPDIRAGYLVVKDQKPIKATVSHDIDDFYRVGYIYTDITPDGAYASRLSMGRSEKEARLQYLVSKTTNLLTCQRCAENYLNNIEKTLERLKNIAAKI